MCGECYGEWCYDKSQPKGCEVSIEAPNPWSYGSSSGNCSNALSACSQEMQAGLSHYWQNGWKDEMFIYAKTGIYKDQPLMCKQETGMMSWGTTICHTGCGTGFTECSESQEYNGELYGGIFCSSDGRCSKDGWAWSELEHFETDSLAQYLFVATVIDDTLCSQAVLKAGCTDYYTACEAQPDNDGKPGGKAVLENSYGSYQLKCEMPSLNSLEGCIPSAEAATAASVPSLKNLHKKGVQDLDPAWSWDGNTWNSAGMWSWGSTGFCFSTEIKTQEEVCILWPSWFDAPLTLAHNLLNVGVGIQHAARLRQQIRMGLLRSRDEERSRRVQG